MTDVAALRSPHMSGHKLGIDAGRVDDGKAGKPGVTRQIQVVTRQRWASYPAVTSLAVSISSPHERCL